MHVDTDLQNFNTGQTFFWLNMVKNGCGHSCLGNLKMAVSQKWTDSITDFLHAGINSGKLKVDSKIFGWAESEMAMAF